LSWVDYYLPGTANTLTIFAPEASEPEFHGKTNDNFLTKYDEENDYCQQSERKADGAG
jgi:hypothetical protein